VSLIGETVKIRREELGLDQLELGRRVGVGQQTVSRWETGAAVPKPDRLPMLAEVLGLDSGYVHRMAGYLPPGQTSAAGEVVHELYARVQELTDEEVLLLIDRCWQEFRRRRGLVPPGVS
jgi:transcriptional regulator with XRE-family HTH domain